MSLDAAILGHVLRNPESFSDFRRAGITAEHFVEDYEKAWKFLVRSKRVHGTVPSKAVLLTRYPDIELVRARNRDIPILLHDLKKRKKFMDFLAAIDDASRRVDSPDDIDAVMTELQQRMNSLAVQGGGQSMVDLFSPEIRKRMIKDLKRRRSATALGIPTTFKRFDYVTGGLQSRRLVVIMGRPGLGKSWLDLLFVASSVIHGEKTMLFPLEMTLEETALRLYTIFSCRMFGAHRAIRNLDLSQGRITMKKIVRLMHKLEDLYAGQLYVADVASLADPYTVDRIEAEVELHKPSLFWVDYITLMKGPSGREGAEDHTTIKALSNGLKGIGQRHDCVAGASAQVNREALKTRAFLPRLEHLAYGDSIGQDADQVIAINRKDEHLYYALVKNRHGPEIGRTRVKFAVDQGDIEETEHQDDDADD